MESKEVPARRRRVRVERGIYRQPSGKYAVYLRLAGKPRFRTVEGDLDTVRRERAALVGAAQAGACPCRPSFDLRRWRPGGSRASRPRSRPASGASARLRRTATTSSGICPRRSVDA
jgi:hypothetical protein